MAQRYSGFQPRSIAAPQLNSTKLKALRSSVSKQQQLVPPVTLLSAGHKAFTVPNFSIGALPNQALFTVPNGAFWRVDYFLFTYHADAIVNNRRIGYYISLFPGQLFSQFLFGPVGPAQIASQVTGYQYIKNYAVPETAIDVNGNFRAFLPDQVLIPQSSIGISTFNADAGDTVTDLLLYGEELVQGV